MDATNPGQRVCLRTIFLVLATAAILLVAGVRGFLPQTSTPHSAPPPTFLVQSSTTLQWPLQLGDNGQPLPECSRPVGGVPCVDGGFVRSQSRR